MLTRKNRLLIIVAVALLVGTAVVIASCSSGTPVEQWDITCEDDLLQKLETSDIEFEKREGTDNIIYWHLRMIDEASVEFDYIRYVFDENTKKLIEKDVHWRDDLPEHLPPIISREEAESMVEGEIQYSKLYYISPESVVFPIEPTPKNPCWIVRILGDEGYIEDVIVIDAVEGKIVGHGVPPPSGGYVLSGPMYTCSGYYEDYYYNARNSFNDMGYPAETKIWPSKAEVKSHIQNNETALFYEIAHSCGLFSRGFQNTCYQCTTASEVADWIEDYDKKALSPS